MIYLSSNGPLRTYLFLSGWIIVCFTITKSENLSICKQLLSHLVKFAFLSIRSNLNDSP